MIEIIVKTDDVRGAGYKCKESVTVEIYYDKNEDISKIVNMFTNLDEWFSGFNESSQIGLIVLWQGEIND